MDIITETETAIKRILPYLKRRGYDLEDLQFERSTPIRGKHSLGHIDILVTCGKKNPQFVIEAKRSSKKITEKDRTQVLEYGKSQNVFFVIVTNGSDIQVLNTQTSAPILWDGQILNKIPKKLQLPRVINSFKLNPLTNSISLTNDKSLPFRPGLPLKQLNGLFSRCHNAIRDIEKDERHAYTDFSKLLFLKLLEEKADSSDF